MIDSDPLLAAIEATRLAILARPTAHWIIAYSGGKDSTAALKIVIAAANKIRENDIKITLIYCDTGVENPTLDRHVKSIMSGIEIEFSKFKNSYQIKILKAPVQDRFFVRIVGRGYPPPTNSFRWCTNGLRIRPVSQFIQAQDPSNTVVVLGIRRNESVQRDRTIDKQPSGRWQKQREGNKNYDLFLPIIDLGVAEVWDAVFWLDNPKAINPDTLLALYQEASGECPIIKSPDAPPCASGRFGCWTCTVVRQDKSAQKLIEAGYDTLKPYLEFRNWLSEIRNDPAARWQNRRNGSVGLGPFTLETRKTMLHRIDLLEKETSIKIIDQAEREAIRILWDMDHLPRVTFKSDTANGKKEPYWLELSEAEIQ